MEAVLSCLYQHAHICEQHNTYDKYKWAFEGIVTKSNNFDMI